MKMEDAQPATSSESGTLEGQSTSVARRYLRKGHRRNGEKKSQKEPSSSIRRGQGAGRDPYRKNKLGRQLFFYLLCILLCDVPVLR